MVNELSSINTFWSIFDEPICIDGKPVGVIEYDENNCWDLTGIFDGTPNWKPKTINTRKTRL